QKLPARGQVEEKLPNFDNGSRWAACCLYLQHLSAADNDLCALGRITVALASDQGETAHAGDTGQGLAAEAHGSDGGKVLGAPNFAGGMALQAEQRIVAAHAQPII